MNQRTQCPNDNTPLFPLVSILINNYNYAKYVKDAVDSALDQNYPFVEVVVVDDGSTDDSLQVLASFGKRIHLIVQENAGQAAAFNAGYRASKGDIICFLDADDLFTREKVESVVKVFKDNRDVSWCFDTPLWIEGASKNPLKHPIGLTEGRCDMRATLERGRTPHMPTATSGLSFRRYLLDRILPMPELIRITSDNYIKLAATISAPGWIDNRMLSLQRIHETNAYTNRTFGKERLVGRTDFLGGIFLARNFQGLRRVGFKMFCRGLAWLWMTEGIERDLKPLVTEQFKSMKNLAKVNAWGRIMSWAIRYQSRRLLRTFRRRARGSLTEPSS
jgi:glycosyltransferase involved in cell wall biosynthesis